MHVIAHLLENMYKRWTERTAFLLRYIYYTLKVINAYTPYFKICINLLFGEWHFSFLSNIVNVRGCFILNDISDLSGKISLGPWSFNVIQLSDIDIYSDYIKKTEYPANLWSSNFAFLWAVSQSKARKVLWKIVDGMLVTFSYLKSGELYLICLPFGKGNPDKVISVLYKCLNYCKSLNNNSSSSVVKVINQLQLDFLKKSTEFDKYFKVINLVGLEKHFSIEKLISLSGKDFETIRRKINKFKRLYPNAVIREYKAVDYDKVMKLGDYWSNTSGQKYSYIFDNTYFHEIIKHYQELNHLVLVVEIDDEIIGMVSGGELPNRQSWWCLSKFMNDYDGLSELLIVELARKINEINPKIELMNAAEDLGPGGLRFFKERFRPVLDLKRYLIKLR